MDGYMKIIDGLLAKSKARAEIAAEDKAAGRLRESASGSGLYDLGDGVPKPDTCRRSSAELLRENAERETEARLRESAGTTLDGIPKPTRLRELGTYGGANGSSKIAFENGSEYQDVTDLFSVLPQTLPNGTANLENSQVEGIAASIQDGKPLSDADIGVLRRLLDKYESQIAALRASPDRGGQDYLDVPNPATARVIESARGQEVGLQPGGQQSDASPGTHPCVDCDKGILPSGASCPTCKGSGTMPGRAQALAESGPLRGLLAPPAPPTEEVLDDRGLLVLPGIPRPEPAHYAAAHGLTPVEPTPSVGRMRSSGSMRETAAAECHLLERFNREVANGKPRRLRETRGRRTPGDSENLTMKEVRELCQEWEGVAV